LLQQLRLLQQTLIAEQRLAARQVVASAGDLDQATATVFLAIAIGFGGVAQAGGQGAGVVFAQVLITAQFTYVAQFAGFVADLGEEGGDAFGGG
jgi:hypothetical protein